MHPELFTIGRFTIHSYGVFMALGFGLGGLWFVRRGRRRGMPADRLLDLVIVIVLAGVGGGRLFYVLTHLSQFRTRPWLAVWPVGSDGTIGLQGLVFYGGLIVAVPLVAWLVRRWQLSPLRTLDAVAPPIALGTAIGRIGCFLNGCCYGRPTTCAWGVVFPPGSSAHAAFPGQPIHPTQLYMVADNLLIIGALLLIERFGRKIDGTLIAAYLIMIGAARGIDDLFRYYEREMQLFSTGGVDITVNHLVGCLLIATGVLLFLRIRRHAPADMS